MEVRQALAMSGVLFASALGCHKHVSSDSGLAPALTSEALQLFHEQERMVPSQHILAEIERLAHAVNLSLDAAEDAHEAVSLLNSFFFSQEGFRGDRDLASPDNLWPDRVLARRRGYCTGLALVYASIAQRLDLPIFGVATPQHMFLRYDDGDTRINIEMLEEGRELSDEQYKKRYNIPDYSVENGVYLQNLDNDGFLSQIANNLGVLRSQAGEFDRSAEIYQQALELDSLNVAAIYNLAKDQMQLDRCSDAIKGFTRALELNPNHISSLNNRGVCRAELGDTRGAEEDFRAALEIDPGSAEARRNLRALEQRSGG